jgi:hypothetical protein
VVLCRKLGLFTRAVVAIDGSKFKAVNNRDKNYTVAKVIGRIEQVDASIARYLRALDRVVRRVDPPRPGGEQAIRLSPFDQLIFAAHVGISLAHFMNGRYEEAAAAARRAIQSNPGSACRP